MSDLPAYLRSQPEGVTLQIRVVPRASRNEICEPLGDRLKIKIAAPPVDSAANEKLIAFLAKQLVVARGAVQITHGLTSRNKTVSVRGVHPAVVTATLSRRT